MTAGASATLKYPALKDLSPGAQAAANWFRQLARGLKACRLYDSGNPIVLRIRGQLHEQLNRNLGAHGTWRIRITPTEMFLLDEPIVRPADHADPDRLPSAEESLPFAFYRDGIRGLTFLQEVPPHDFDALFEALLAAGGGPLFHDDLVTLLWQANPVRIRIEAVPVTQTIYLSSRKAEEGSGERRRGLAYVWSPSGSEIHADIGQATGVAQGLHLDTFDDWPLPRTYVDVPAAYAVLTQGMQFVRTVLLAEWAAESGTDWTASVPELFRKVRALDPGPDTLSMLAQSLVTWLASAVQRCAWTEAQGALTLLREFDPDGSLSDDGLATAISGLDGQAIAERLDESETEEQSRFFALAVAMGRPALDLGCTVLARAVRARTRAAACTMLCYLCSDRPELLAPYLSDGRWYVVRNAVFVLGQIGGQAVVELLQQAAAHPDRRVRRQVVLSLGNVPEEDRLPILASQLHSEDLRLLSATLNLLARTSSPNAVRALLHHVQAPNFESRGPERQRLLLNALAELAGAEAVPTLVTLLEKGGWFARRTLQRLAAARALRRVGTETALAALEHGLRSGNEAVREACLEALSAKSPE